MNTGLTISAPFSGRTFELHRYHGRNDTHRESQLLTLVTSAGKGVPLLLREVMKEKECSPGWQGDEQIFDWVSRRLAEER